MQCSMHYDMTSLHAFEMFTDALRVLLHILYKKINSRVYIVCSNEYAYYSNTALVLARENTEQVPSIVSHSPCQTVRKEL